MPLAPLASLQLAQGQLRGIFCDVDDTLTEGGLLVPDAFAALAAAHAAGLRVVPVTGRPAGWAATFAATWPVDAAIGENGAVRFEHGPRANGSAGRGLLEAHFWDDEPTRAAHGRRLSALSEEILREVPGARLASDQWLRRCDLAFDIGETTRLPEAEEDALVGAIAERVTRAGCQFTRSSIHAHAQPGAHDKVKMAARLARARWGEDLEATRDRYLFIGDSPNDEAGFAFFPLSIGVANVRRFTLSSPPAFATTRPSGHGFAEAVAHALDAIR